MVFMGIEYLIDIPPALNIVVVVLSVLKSIAV